MFVSRSASSAKVSAASPAKPMSGSKYLKHSWGKVLKAGPPQAMTASLQPRNALNYIFGYGQGRLRVDVAPVIQVSDGNANQLRLKFPHRGFSLGQVVLGEHQVENLQRVALWIYVRRHVSQAEG